ncbi:thiamine phosphate synthase [Eremococcus coleocola]|uniref:Thiamine-phosphate synthase n=1 Tax=Eremococcus coleocola ACS-139-V-Col8 TaxID=908337 RepID=E4KND2_9LACT|nr:thiamine phosphate synthase [Eremococcus coleocola]EFR31554.1 thiamine-phosphate diphosphorylase [Eremococcus coleocola ACS-139-V-Col8]
MKQISNPYRLYLVTDPTGLSADGFLQVIDQACQAGVSLVQLREKTATSRDLFQKAQAVKAITDRYQIPLIIDDRLDICQAVGAAGLHVGDEDLPVEVARKILGPDAIIGVSSKSLDAAQAAVAGGASYLGVGAIFPTKTKVKTQATSIETLKKITRTVPVPVVAIGGIKSHNLDQLTASGVAGVAMVSEIMQAPDVAGKVAELNQLLTQVL